MLSSRRVVLHRSQEARPAWRIDRPAHRVPNDGIVALAMALNRLNKAQPIRLLGWV